MILKITSSDGSHCYELAVKSFCVKEPKETILAPLPPMEFVTIKTPWHSYEIGKYPVTQEQWDKYKRCRKTKYDVPNLPVVNITWYEANDFCKHYGYRLLTEEEWEFAATSGYREYPWGNEPETTLGPIRTNNYDTGPGKLTPVNTHDKGATPTGIYDMLGNCWEWTSSIKDTIRVLRGGSCYNVVGNLRLSCRDHDLVPGDRASLVGFRCAKDIKE